MAFFEPPPPPPEAPPRPPRRPWHGPPDNVVGRTVALNLLLGRSDKATLWIASATVYSEGFEFDVELRHRLDEGEVEHPFFMHHPRRRRQQTEGPLDPDLVRFGMEFSDGRKATNLGSQLPLPLPGDPDTPPVGPVLSPSRGGGGGGGRWHHGFWAWPLPPEGPLAFVCEWPIADIPETRSEVDSALIRDAAAEVVELWPEQKASGSVGHGGQYTMLQSVRAQPRPETRGHRPQRNEAERWLELTVESVRKTQLIDITERVGELVRGADGTAVVIFVPHTTAGVVLQAAGEGASNVAADIEATLERVVDEGWSWQHSSEGDRNPSSHARSALTASSVTVPLEGGELVLGELQRIFFCEFDGPRSRRVQLRVI